MARKKRKRIASRGSVNTTILKTLINGDKYGYEIIKEVEEYSEGKIVLKQPSLYSSLSRFEEKGIVSSYWGDSDIGGRRHYYHLTDLGHKYYNENVLKHKDTEEELEEKPTTTIDNVENTEITKVDIENKTINPISSEPISLIKENTTITITPSTKEIISKEDDEDYKIIKRLAEQVKISKRKAVGTPLTKLHFIKPPKAQKVVLDSDGIYKLRDIDYVSNSKKEKEKVVDNVIKRTSPTIYGYPTYTEKKSSPHKEMSEEERKMKNQLFIEKFNHLTQSRIKTTEVKDDPTPVIKEEKDIDYRSKLDLVIENSKTTIINTPTPTPQEESKINNLFTYEEENQFQKDNAVEEDDNDKFIDFEPTEFEVKNQESHYNEEISNFTSTNNEITLNRYEHKSKPISDEKNYVLINKVRLFFGLILGLFLSLELLISYAVFKKFDLLIDGDNKFYIIIGILSFILTISYIIPYFVNKSKHTYNNFKLKYALVLGILAFLIMLILIYCINTLMGFELDNFKYFAVKLIVPAILAFNFVILPPIYFGLINNRSFYD